MVKKLVNVTPHLNSSATTCLSTSSTYMAQLSLSILCGQTLVFYYFKIIAMYNFLVYGVWFWLAGITRAFRAACLEIVMTIKALIAHSWSYCAFCIVSLSIIMMKRMKLADLCNTTYYDFGL